MQQAIMCPQCNAPLTPHRFARSIVCAYCGATVQFDESSVSTETFRNSFRIWNSPQSYGVSSWISTGDRHWTIEKLLAHGDISNVYFGRLARWPTELVIIKILRDQKHRKRFDNQWDTLKALRSSDAPGADTFTRLIPQPVTHGEITAGEFSGQKVSVYRWAGGFHHTFVDVIQAYPQGIPPRASIWVWRRILEILSFIHASGMVHGAVLPSHLMIHDLEHGVRLVGYSSAGQLNEKLHFKPPAYKQYYPKPAKSWSTLTSHLDLVMSARCIAAILGGNPETGSLPSAVPPQLADTIQRLALDDPDKATNESAWAVREELGQIAGKVFGKPRYIPIRMPP
jgi:hypothetical protein